MERLKLEVPSLPAETPTTSAPTEFVKALFPDAIVPVPFILEIYNGLKMEEVCATCTGGECKKRRYKGYRMLTPVENGEVSVKYKRCKYALQEQWRKLSKIPVMYEGKSFEDYRTDNDNVNAVKWAHKLESLYLYGCPGCGKTFLAAIMAQELLKQGCSVLFNDVPSLLDKLKATFDKESRTTLDSLMERLARVDVLVLDDFGVETPTEWAVERLYLIVNARYVAGKKLIVTSNFDLKANEARLNKAKGALESVTGSRIVSRIRGMCKITPIFGGDRRRC